MIILYRGQLKFRPNFLKNWEIDTKWLKCSLAAPGFWFGVESRGNGSVGANAGGPGGYGPPDGSEVSFFKTIQSIRKWIHFSKIAHFFLTENTFFLDRKYIFSNKNFKNRSYFTRISEYFGKIYRILIFLEELYKSRKIPDELY